MSESLEETPHRMLRLFDRHEGSVWLDPDDEPIIRHAWQNYVDTGRDGIITVTTAGGAPYTIALSDIGGLMESTREQRERDHSIVVLAEREYHDVRRSYWPSAPD